jgi:carboxypeptidase C (cathepsin A)
MYIPYAAKAIVDGNDKTTDKINLKGILIGNGRITSNTDIINNAIVQYFKGRNFFDL